MARIEREHLDELGRGRLVHLAELVEHARLGQRVRGLEQTFVEQADLPRPEAAETSRPVGRAEVVLHRVPAIVKRISCR